MPLSSTKLLRISKLNSIFYEWTKKFYNKKKSLKILPLQPLQILSTKFTKKNFFEIYKKQNYWIFEDKTTKRKRKRKRDQLVQSGVRVEIEQRKKKGGKEKKKNDATKGRLNGIPRGEALILLLSRF